MPPNPGNFLHSNHENAPTCQNYKELSAYDEMRPKNEPLFLSKIRDIEKSIGFLTPLRWTNIITILAIHVIILSWLARNLYLGIFSLQWKTWFYLYFIYLVGTFGVTVGVHRYWSHRTFKANTPLRWILLACYALSGVTTIKEWARDHRVHHKFTETISDPHDANRGFFFAHIGWIMMKRHPAVLREGRKIDLSDIYNDPIAQLHDKHFLLMKLIFVFVIPCCVPPLLWGENWESIILGHMLLFFIIGTHIVFSVNSFAHMFGTKPYDPNINPADNWFLSIFTLGEAWHNYHHTFPWDYKASEIPYLFNPSTLFLDFFAAIGWAYDLKSASPEMVQEVIKNRGANKIEETKDSSDHEHVN